MSAEELDADTAKFDREFIADESRPLTPRLKARLRKASRKRGRPRIGKGSKRVLVTIERGLLKRADSLVRRKKVSRSQLISRGLKAVLAAAE
jgi:hypothetical protein